MNIAILLCVLSSLKRWRGETIPDIVGTVVVEPSTACCVHRIILVGKVVSPLWGDELLPVKFITPCENTLHRNAKIADVYPCIALEDFDILRCKRLFRILESSFLTDQKVVCQ